MKEFVRWVVVAFAVLLSGCTVLGAVGGYKACGTGCAVVGAVMGDLADKEVDRRRNPPPPTTTYVMNDKGQLVPLTVVRTVQMTTLQQGGYGFNGQMAVREAEEESAGGQQEAKDSPEAEGCPTKKDYMSAKWSQANSPIPADCRTGSMGHDSFCLKNQVTILVGKKDKDGKWVKQGLQEACKYDARKCNPNMDYAKTAWCFDNLADELQEAEARYAVK
ncbi:MAG: hypothetical protein WC791_01595 [Candidatus Paceibacterota bacterium]